MDKIRCKIDGLRSGMVIAKDVMTYENQLLIAAESVLTPRLIARLKFYQIPFVYVYPIKKTENVAQGYYKMIESTEEFKGFNRTLRATARNLERSLNSSIQYRREIPIMSLLKDVESILDGTRNGLHLMEMLQCIRSYDDITYVHSINVSLICSIIGEWLGFSKEDQDVLILSGLLHDYGKLVMPPRILTKPGKLTDKEYNIMKSHTKVGYELLKEYNLDERILLSALEHHERCDGTGYPMQLNGSEMNDFAKIVAIADVYDAMTANRVYRQGICPFHVIETLEREGLQKYEPKYLIPFLERICQCYIHTNVLLSNNLEGEVIMINKNDLSRPIVKVASYYIDLSENHSVYIKSFK